MMADDWRVDAACLQVQDKSIFFPVRGTPNSTIAAAKLVCSLCPVKNECLAEAMSDVREITGIWGGLAHGEREKLARQRRKLLRNSIPVDGGTGSTEKPTSPRFDSFDEACDTVVCDGRNPCYGECCCPTVDVYAAIGEPGYDRTDEGGYPGADD